MRADETNADCVCLYLKRRNPQKSVLDFNHYHYGSRAAVVRRSRVFTAFTGEKSTEKADHEKKGTCYLLDEVGIFQQNLEMFQELYPELDFQIAENENLETLKQEIKEKEDDSLIYIEKTDGQPVVHVVNANFMKGISAKNTAAVCDQIMQSQSLRELAWESSR